MKRESRQYQVRCKYTDQLLKTGTIQVTHTYRKNFVVKGFNPRTVSNIVHKVADTHNLKVTDLEMLFFEKGY